MFSTCIFILIDVCDENNQYLYGAYRPGFKEFYHFK